MDASGGPRAYVLLTELSDDIGGRVTSSPQATQAIAWGLARMEDIGLENVHAEKWPLSRGWTRISAHAEIVAPIHRRLMVDSMGWVGSTPSGGIEADVVSVDTYRLDDEIKQNESKWAGKILLVVQRGAPPGNRFQTFAAFGPFLEAAYVAQAAAVIGGQGGSKSIRMHLTRTGTLGFDSCYEIPAAGVASEDQDVLERFLDRGETVRLKMDVQDRVTSEPVETANAVGEIRGREHPDEIVVVGAHL